MIARTTILRLIGIATMAVAAGQGGAAVNTGGPAGVVLSAAEAAPLQQTVAAAPWTPARPVPASCPTIYILSSPTCPFCHAFIKESMSAMFDAGYDMRLLLATTVGGPSADGIAEVALRRDLVTFMKAQFGKPIPAPSIQTSNERIDAFNGLVRATNAVSDVAHRHGYPGYTPGFLWQDRTGRWRIRGGYSKAAMAPMLATIPTPGPECARRTS